MGKLSKVRARAGKLAYKASTTKHGVDCLARLRWAGYKRPTRICAICGTEFAFSPSRKNRTTCSRKCANTYISRNRWDRDRAPQVFANCKTCNILFSYQPSRRGRKFRKAKYCSTSCQHDGMRGFAPADSYRDTREYRRWVRLVHARAANGCERCGEKDAKFHAHHIIPVSVDPSKACDLSNGMLLCIPCHKEIHKLMRQTILSQPAEGIVTAEGATTTRVSPNDNPAQEPPTLLQ